MSANQKILGRSADHQVQEYRSGTQSLRSDFVLWPCYESRTPGSTTKVYSCGHPAPRTTNKRTGPFLPSIQCFLGLLIAYSPALHIPEHARQKDTLKRNSGPDKREERIASCPAGRCEPTNGRSTRDSNDVWVLRDVKPSIRGPRAPVLRPRLAGRPHRIPIPKHPP